MPKLALLDGHSLAYRAFFALPTDLATPAGQVTNAVYGFTSMLIKLFGDEHPDAAAVAWDTPEQTFRSEAYPEYKATRSAAPDLFREQLPLITEVVEALKLHQVKLPGYEADDVIATLAEQATEAGWEVVIVTGDRDAFQLVGEGVRVVYTRRGISDTVDATPEWLEERYGITPDQYVEYAALRGDPSDNLPGVTGVGEKTAAKLLANYGSLEGIYEHLDDQTPKLKENLAAAKEQVFLNRRLMALDRESPVDVDVSAFELEPWDREEVRTLFDALAFRSLWERLEEGLGEGAVASREAIEVEWASETDPAEIARLFEGEEPIAIQPLWMGGELAGLAVAVAADRVAYVPVDAIGAAAAALDDESVRLVAHDAKPLARWLLERDMGFRGLAFDTALAAYVINPAERAPELGPLAGSILGIEVDSPAADADAAGAGDGQAALDFDADEPDVAGAARAAVALRQLVEPLRERLEARGGTALYEDIELPLMRVLARMEVAGIGVDRDYLVEFGETVRDRLASVEKDIYAAAGEPFNVNSTLQLREVLFERLGLPILKKTPKGAPSTDATVLSKLADEHPIVENLLRYRELEKLRSTYVDALLPLIADDGRIHARFVQTGAATGRLSSEHPNLQNIPIRSEEGRAIRQAFVADPGARFVVADYSQIELRILAHLSGDAGLVEAFTGGHDIHLETAARVWGVDAADVTPEMRRRAKMINFGLLYGMEAYGLAQRLEIEQDEAAEHMAAYFEQFPEVKDFMGGIVDEARSTGYTTTILGRRRYLPELASRNFRERQMGERMALNAPIQGSAADIIKKAMIELDAEFEDADDGTAILLQVHDELVLEAPEDRAEAVAANVKERMERVVELDVPLVVDVAVGDSLADVKS